ncbi:Uncharacterized protein HZ326_23913 [Fusarium oxysporum f. sp. albedinis]|nr:Uncharacterized protein HZ326_23913 [Fusarium oxysporum f. sp. albedinis]
MEQKIVILLIEISMMPCPFPLVRVRGRCSILGAFTAKRHTHCYNEGQNPLNAHAGANITKRKPLHSELSRCVFYITGRAIVIAVILQSDPSIKINVGLGAGSQTNQELTHIH